MKLIISKEAILLQLQSPKFFKLNDVTYYFMDVRSLYSIIIKKIDKYFFYLIKNN